MACYQGSYSGAYRTVPASVQEIDVIIGANQFKQAVQLIDDDAEIGLREEKDGLRLKAESTEILLKYVDRHIEPLPLSDREPDVTVQCRTTDRRAGFLDEFQMASHFVAASVSKPIYTGVNLVLGGDYIGLEAHDGICLLYRAVVKARGGRRIKDPLRVTVPTADFLLGLQLCVGKDDVDITVDGTRIEIVGNGAAFNASVLQGAWPNVNKMVLGVSDHARKFEIAALDLRRAVAAVKYFGSSTDLQFTPKGNEIELSTSGEQGRFISRVPGKLAAPVKYDADALGLISELGDPITFLVDIDAPLKVLGGHRNVWIMQRLG
jgi:DNA polymerase III sliding clamp (beta) subunit (PCNA family)